MAGSLHALEGHFPKGWAPHDTRADRAFADLFDRCAVGRSLTLPGVRSMTGLDLIAPAITQPVASAPDSPSDELIEELTRTIKAAYQ